MTVFWFSVKFSGEKIIGTEYLLLIIKSFDVFGHFVGIFYLRNCPCFFFSGFVLSCILIWRNTVRKKFIWEKATRILLFFLCFTIHGMEGWIKFFQQPPEFNRERENTRSNSKEGSGTLENVPSPSHPGARAGVESNADTPSGWSSKGGGANFFGMPEGITDTRGVLDKVSLFHQHRHARGRDATTGSLHKTLSVHTTALEQTYMAEECDENDYHLDLDSYKPVQPLAVDHGVALFPVAAPHNGMDLHLLQVNHLFSLFPS